MSLKYLRSLLLFLLLPLSVAAQTVPDVLAEVRCPGTRPTPRVTLFADGRLEVITDAVETSHVSPDQLLFLRAMCEDESRRNRRGWLSFVPEDLYELVVTLPVGGTWAVFPAYVHRSGIPPTNFTEDGASSRSSTLIPPPRLGELVIDLLAAAGCPELVEHCR